jgi:hypothetical protein
MRLSTRLRRRPNDRVAMRVSAASYGTVLVLAALALLNADDVASGHGWELLTGVGFATWLAHLYAEMMGDHLRHTTAPGRAELGRAMADALPILLAAVAPAGMLLLGRLDVLAPGTALTTSIAVALVQLVGVGTFVGLMVSNDRSRAWLYGAATAVFGLAIVALKVALAH